MSLLHDVRLALRLLRRAPVSTGIALTSIALSVGATAVVFAAIKSVLIDPLPYARPSELVQLRSEFPHMAQQSHGDWVVWNDASEVARRTSTPLGRVDRVACHRLAILGVVYRLDGKSNGASTPVAALKEQPRGFGHAACYDTFCSDV